MSPDFSPMLEAVLQGWKEAQAAQQVQGGGGGLPPTLPPERGDGTPEDMEPRVARLEVQFEYVRRDLDQLLEGQKAILAKLDTLTNESTGLKERVAHLPGKDWVGQHFRNWIVGAGAVLSVVTLASRFIGS